MPCPPPPACRQLDFEVQGGPDAILRLPSVGPAIPLAEIYAFTDMPEPGAREASAGD